MNWTEILSFARGPLFQVSLLIFIAGMVYRLVKVAGLGWSRNHVRPKRSEAKGVFMSYLKGILIWPFVPWVKNTFKKNPIIYLAGGLFHLGLFVILVLGTPHMLAWKSMLGFGWKTLRLPIVDWFAAVTIIAMVMLFINRLINPVLKLLTGPAEWLNLLFVFLPVVSGYALTHHLSLNYQMSFSIHMLTIDFLLIWIPFSRISHFVFYFFSRTIHGQEFAKHGVRA